MQRIIKPQVRRALNLSVLSSDPAYWDKLSLQEINDILWRVWNGKCELPKELDIYSHGDKMIAVIKCVQTRLQNFNNEQMIADCEALNEFVTTSLKKSEKKKWTCNSREAVAEHFLQVKTVINFCAAKFTDVTQYSGFLANAYFLLGSEETANLCNEFTELTKEAYQAAQLGFNQTLAFDRHALKNQLLFPGTLYANKSRQTAAIEFEASMQMTYAHASVAFEIRKHLAPQMKP